MGSAAHDLYDHQDPLGGDVGSTAPRHTKLALKVHGDLLLSVSMAGSRDGGVLSPEDITQLMDALRSEPTKLYVAGFIGSAGSTAMQRKEGAELIRSRNIPVAVITDDRLVRGFVTAVSWIGANVSAFSWSKARGAMDFLKIDPKRAEGIMTSLSTMRDGLIKGQHAP